MDMDLGKIIIGLIVGLLGWFLKNTMDDLKTVKAQSLENKASLDLLRMEYNGKFENLTEKVTELKETLGDLIQEIKKLNASMHQNR